MIPGERRRGGRCKIRKRDVGEAVAMVMYGG